MDLQSKKQILQFYQKYKKIFENEPIADLGSFDVNGSVKRILPDIDIIGFDINKGPGVDISIKLGEIPQEHKNKYSIVTAIHSFQFCPETEIFKKEILDLLKKEGLLFLLMCSKNCFVGKHKFSLPSNKFFRKRGVCFIWSLQEIEDFFKDSFNIINCYDTGPGRKHHRAYILEARKK